MPVTTTTEIGRGKLVYPDLGYQGGAGLHALVGDMFTELSNNQAVKYSGSITLADSAFEDIVHNFNVAQSQLYVQVFESDAMISEEDKANNYTFAAQDTNTLRVTNNSGGSKTFYVYIWAMNIEKMMGVHSYFYQTTDVTLSVAATYATATNRTAMVDIDVVARKDGTISNVYSYKLMVENNAGVANLTQISATNYEEDVNYSVVVDTSTANLRVRVQGQVGVNVDWHIRLKTSYII